MAELIFCMPVTWIGKEQLIALFVQQAGKFITSHIDGTIHCVASKQTPYCYIHWGFTGYIC